MSPLDKVIFLKNICLSDTSKGGKRWQKVAKGTFSSGLKVEEEYYMNEHYGIASKSIAYGFMDYPLRLECVLLGSNFSEKEANSATLE